ncbi:4Fe-4S dicluster domain-containing protein [Slackia exigua]|uniref:4Fe-4S dicluster domain-containing protein n=1 Tax=Slackia exigua TaxID=84109 RepID=UPI003AB94B40
MPSIDGMAGVISRLDGPDITVRKDRCVLVRNRNAGCTRCAEACTSGCISFSDGGLHVDQGKCIGCGTCATVCPTCALEAHNPNDAQLLDDCLKAFDSDGCRVCIGCAELLDRAQGLYDPTKVVRVECLGRVEESLLTALVQAGARDISLACGTCASCMHRSGFDVAERVCGTQRVLLEAWGMQADVRISHKMPSYARLGRKGYDPFKRAAFAKDRRSVRDAGFRVAKGMLDDASGNTETTSEDEGRYAKVMADGTLPHFLPDRRERLLDSLAALGEPEDVMMATRLWGHVVIDVDACVSCRMCATFCPTGAIAKFEDADGTFGVEHYPGDCVKCRCCVNICPAHALTLSEEVFAVDMLAGMADRYEMKPVEHPKGKADSIWRTARTFTRCTQVFER